MRAAVLTVRFLCELAALAAVAYWAWHTAGGGVAGAALAVACLAGFAAVWGAFLAPKRRIDMQLAARLAIELAVWVLAAAGLWSAGQPGPAVALFAAAVLTGALNGGLGP